MSDCDSNTQYAQDRIAQALRDRGYAKGYTPQQYAARQALKIVEELSEAIQCLDIPDGSNLQIVDRWNWLLNYMAGVEALARDLFDSGFAPEIRDAGKFVKELADVVTPAFVAAQELEVDLTCLAIETAEANIKRGVR